VSHSYEEIRSAALDVIRAGTAEQYQDLIFAIGQLFAEREGRIQPGHFGATYDLDRDDRELLLEVFWDLFRQGIITLGKNDGNRDFPWFRPTRLGQRAFESSGVFLVHDISGYERTIRAELPSLSDVTMLYLQEAMQAFRSGCILSSTVMLGVAAEHEFLRLLEAVESGPYSSAYSSVSKERTILQKIMKFRNLLEPNLKALPGQLREDLDTQFLGIQSLIRNFRNESGHPTGKTVSREQVFVLLQLFIPYCKKLYALRAHFQ
jgi:hypothetical protein